MGRIKIRAHHLDSFLSHYFYEQDQLGQILMRQGYVDTPDHAFVAYVYHIFQKMKNPAQRIQVVVGTEDIICRKCPKKRNCKTIHPEQDQLFGTPFYKEDYFKSEKDRVMARAYNVEHGHEYRSLEIFPEFA